MDGFLVVAAFVVLFLARLSGGAGDRPAVPRRRLHQGPADRPGGAAHAHSSTLLPSGRGAGILFVGSLMGPPPASPRYIYRFADNRGRPAARRPRAGEHLRQPIFSGKSGWRSPTSAASAASRSTPCARRLDAPFAAAVTSSSATSAPLPPRSADHSTTDRDRARRRSSCWAASCRACWCTGDADVDGGWLPSGATSRRAPRAGRPRATVARFLAGRAGDRRAGDPDRGACSPGSSCPPRHPGSTAAYAALISSLVDREPTWQDVAAAARRRRIRASSAILLIVAVAAL